MAEFWKGFTGFIVIYVFADLTFSNMDFFQYSFFEDGKFLWLSALKFMLEVMICAPVFMAVYYLLENIPKWRMAAKYKAAEREREKEKAK